LLLLLLSQGLAGPLPPPRLGISTNIITRIVPGCTAVSPSLLQLITTVHTIDTSRSLRDDPVELHVTDRPHSAPQR